MNSSHSSAQQAPEEFSTLNAQLANMKVKKMLQLADNIRNDSEVTFTATRSRMDADKEIATKDLVTQGIKIDFDSSASQGKFLATVTSLAARLPAFDHINYKGKRYLKIKSSGLVFASSSAESAAGQVVIVPTDDPKLNVIIVPVACLTQQSHSQTFTEQVLATLTSL